MSVQRILLAVSNIPNGPGIYKFISKNGEILYVGKAKNLQKRVTSYTKSDLSLRLSRMVFLVEDVEYITTDSETEALLLEARLIKQYQPNFNILLKDDKSFPYIVLRLDSPFPQILKKHSKIPPKERHFGPFASSKDVDSTLLELQKIFKLRSCSDSYFADRKRPCLQYQIQRCRAPCVGKIEQKDYMTLVAEVEDFLSGKAALLQEQFAKDMSRASEAMEYEKAAIIRDKIRALSYIQLQHGKQNFKHEKVDLMICISKADIYAVLVAFYRAGQYFGNKVYFPQYRDARSESEVLEYFIEEFYVGMEKPEEIIVNNALGNVGLFDMKVTHPTRGDKLHLIESFMDTASKALQEHLKEHLQKHFILSEIQRIFHLDAMPRRIEIYDNSHIMGKYAVGAMVVAGPDGFLKKEYRAYNLESTNKNGGDDYAMFREVMTRRLTKILENPESAPDLMIIDGGRGQMSSVYSVMQSLKCYIPFVCMSKGPNRNAGLEQFHILDREVFTLDPKSKVMHYLQILRDEAHNYGIKKHRMKRSKDIRSSALDSIDGLGPKRKKDLLNLFGSIEGIKNASAKEIARVSGIGKVLAEKILSLL